MVHAPAVSFAGDRLHIKLSEGRELSVPYRKIPWLRWLAKATPKQRADWSVGPGGYAIYWEQLDDGIEVCHVPGMESLN